MVYKKEVLSDNSIHHHVLCNLCGKKFSFDTEEQTPGFRMLDTLNCPHCGAELDRSMQIEFLNVKKEED